MKFDIAIAGGGLVGALSGLLLARQHPQWQIGVIEPSAKGPAADKRTIALAAGTVELLQTENLWASLASVAEPIRHIHVSDRGFAGMTRLHAKAEGVPALGQVVLAQRLNQVLFDASQSQSNLTWLGGHAVEHVLPTLEHVELKLTNEKAVQAKLVVGADGQRSVVREQLGIAFERIDYNQVGIIGTLSLATSLNGWAYERFTETGPMALLPAGDNQAALVWSLPPEQAQSMLALPRNEFLRACQQAFGFRAGRFTEIQGLASFPLQLALAERSVAHRSVLIGNASHSLHPIAGQGFNLGVRDVLALVNSLEQAEDPGAYAVLRDYWRQREQDYQRTIGLTEWLVHGFSNRYGALVMPRNISLLALERLAPARHRFARQAMGKA